MKPSIKLPKITLPSFMICTLLIVSCYPKTILTCVNCDTKERAIAFSDSVVKHNWFGKKHAMEKLRRTFSMSDSTYRIDYTDTALQGIQGGYIIEVRKQDGRLITSIGTK